MSRTIKTAKRPAPHILDPDPDLSTDYNGRCFCRCGLIETDSVHVTGQELVADLPPTPPEAAEIDARILGGNE